jgi:hypothetical protein
MHADGLSLILLKIEVFNVYEMIMYANVCMHIPTGLVVTTYPTNAPVTAKLNA